MSDITSDTIGRSAILKAKWRLIPFCTLLYIINILDRNNISYAALTMNSELGITPSAFGALSGAFFISYFLFEVPSNMAMHRVGARKWMARIMISWGVVVCCMFWSSGFSYLWLMRFLLGAMAAGFFPGMIYYFTFWFPARERAKVISLFFLSGPLMNCFAAPFSGWVLDNIHWWGFSGWRWLFIFEGIPPIVCGIITFYFLTNKPAEAKWLTPAERDWLSNEIASEKNAQHQHRPHTFKTACTSPMVWFLAMTYMIFLLAAYTSTNWMTIILKESADKNMSNTTFGWFLAIPYAFGAVCMLFWGHHSDKTKERIMHAAIPMGIAALGLFLIAVAPSFGLKISGLIIFHIGLASFFGPFWTLPTLLLTAEGAAVGIAIINSCASVSGFVGNSLMGNVKSTGISNETVLLFLAACAALAAAMMVSFKIYNSRNKHVQ